MALDDFTTEKPSEDKEFKTRKKLKNVDLPERWWEITITSHPAVAMSAAGFVDEASTKAILQKFDEAIDDEIKGIKVGDSEREDLEEYKQIIVEDYL